MCEPISAAAAMSIMAGAAVASTGLAIQQGQAAKSDAKKARNQAREASEAEAALQDQERNRLNKKAPTGAGAMQDANSNAATQGIGSTMLTGPSGIDPTALNLNANTLLGQ